MLFENLLWAERCATSSHLSFTKSHEVADVIPTEAWCG